MSVRPLKCYGECNGKYLKDEMRKIGALNYCFPCADKKEKETKDMKSLYHTIQTLYNIPFPNGQMLKQMKMYREERNYTYEGITKTLCYAHKILKMTFMPKMGLGLLPYHYDNAQKYYKELEERRNNMEDDSTIKVVTVKINPLKHHTEHIRQKAFIKMEGLI